MVERAWAVDIEECLMEKDEHGGHCMDMKGVWRGKVNAR